MAKRTSYCRGLSRRQRNGKDPQGALLFAAFDGVRKSCKGGKLCTSTNAYTIHQNQHRQPTPSIGPQTSGTGSDDDQPHGGLGRRFRGAQPKNAGPAWLLHITMTTPPRQQPVGGSPSTFLFRPLVVAPSQRATPRGIPHSSDPGNVG